MYTNTKNMKKLILILASQIILLSTIASAGDDGAFARAMNPKHLGLHKMEKLTHFHFYWHDYAKGPNPSAVKIHEPASNSSFGSLSMFDDLLTTGKPKNSSVVGKAQGFYAEAAQGDITYMMVMNFAFKTGKYNGSTITILGRNPVFSKVREMPIVGGSGMFRFARGYVEARTTLFDFNTGESNVEYNCYVLHY